MPRGGPGQNQPRDPSTAVFIAYIIIICDDITIPYLRTCTNIQLDNFCTLSCRVNTSPAFLPTEDISSVSYLPTCTAELYPLAVRGRCVLLKAVEQEAAPGGRSGWRPIQELARGQRAHMASGRRTQRARRLEVRRWPV